MKKKCSKCEIEKPEGEFYEKKDRKNGSSFCKDCFNKYCMNRWRERKIEAIQYKGGECIDCGFKHPEYPADIFEFHHLNPAEKEFVWAKMRLKSWDKITKELDKCVLLCANCHRIRHYHLNLAAPQGIEPQSKV